MKILSEEYLQNSIPGVSFATWRFILGQMVHSCRGVPANFDPRCFFCNLEVQLRPDGPQFWDAVADIKHPRHEKVLSGVKASKSRLMSEAEARRKKKPQELATKKMQAVLEETS